MSKIVISMTYDINTGEIVTPAGICYGGFVLPVTYALWDTGSAYSSVSSKVVTAMKMKPCGNVMARSIDLLLQKEYYDIDIMIQDERFSGIKAIEADLGPNEPDLIIGMDVIRQGKFILNPNQSVLTFTFRR